MFDSFMANIAPNASHKILDIGVTPDTSLPESNFFEQWYPYPEQITTTSIEDASAIESVFKGVRFIQVEPGHLPFDDDQFDVVFCSAVLEHVGSRQAQAEFVHEAVRVSKMFFFTTPNRWFPIDFHTLIPLTHWLPQASHQQLLRLVGHDFLSRTENLNLLDTRALRSCFEGVQDLHIDEHKLFGMTSNLIAWGNK